MAVTPPAPAILCELRLRTDLGGPKSILQGAPIELRLGFVDLDFECSTVTAKADGNLAEVAGQLGKMVEVQRWARSLVK